MRIEKTKLNQNLITRASNYVDMKYAYLSKNEIF